MADLSHKPFKRGFGKSEADAAARDYVARRLTAISNAKPVACPPLTSKPRGERAPRQSVFRLARLFTSRFDSIRCVVVNLSADGARVTLEGAYTLPDDVVLSFDQSCVKKKARIVWRQDRDLGLCFVKDEKPADDEDNADGFDG